MPAACPAPPFAHPSLPTPPHPQALAGGGAKNINFNELAADLAEITFTMPFRIPPVGTAA